MAFGTFYNIFIHSDGILEFISYRYVYVYVYVYRDTCTGKVIILKIVTKIVILCEIYFHMITGYWDCNKL